MDEKERKNKKLKKNELNAFTDPDLMPCLKEGHLSRACLEQYHYDSTKCKIYFENYKACKKFWGKIASERRKNGIEPAMPTQSEREEIKRLQTITKKPILLSPEA